jgi:hypothetical protein
MNDAHSVAARILVVYDAALPFGRPATLPERIVAMSKTIELLGLKETSSRATLKEIVRAAVESTL